jgi:putative DNA-invertase from lambdoid prophage Rac
MIRTPILNRSPAVSRLFAYCRVSTTEQTTENQLREIETAGFAVSPQRVISETVSGSVPTSERQGFGRLLDKMEAGDVLVVTKLDRLGRNAMDVRATVEALDGMGIRVHCLALGGVDLCSPAGKMTMTQAGLARAKAEGKSLGRPRALTPTKEAEALRRLREGEAVAAVARELETSRQTIMRLRDAAVTEQA